LSLLKRGLASQSRRGHAWSLMLFTLIPALGGIAPFVVIPAITAKLGIDVWASAAIAASVGGAGAVVAELGWGVVGPQQLARNPNSTARLFEESLASRMLAVLVMAPVAGLVTYLIVGNSHAAAALIAAATTAAALSPAWVFIGQGRPWMILAIDTGPKVAASLLAAVLIYQGEPLMVYAIVLIVAVIATYALATTVGQLPAFPAAIAFRRAPAVFRRQLVVIAGRCVSTVYTSLPTPILGIVNPGSVAAYAAVDRPARMGLGILGGVPSKLQSWIAQGPRDDLKRRCRVVVAINAGLGLSAGLVFFVLGPPLIEILFSGTLTPGMELILWGAFVVFLICTSRGLGLALVAVDSLGHITVAITVSAVVGIIGIIALGTQFGSGGAMAAVALAEATGILIQCVALGRSSLRPQTSTG